MASESERLLVQSIRAGGLSADAAYAELVARYEGRLRAFARSKLANPAAVDDVVQEVFIGFLRGLANFDEARSLETWLFTIAQYKVTDELRKRTRRPESTGQDPDDDPFARAADPRQHAASSIARNQERRDLEAVALTRALKQLLDDLLRKGDVTRVMVLELLFVKNLPNWQVAEKLGVNDQQVANYRFSAVKKLTEAVQAAGLPADVFPDLAGG